MRESSGRTAVIHAIEQLKASRELLATNRAEALNVESTETDGTDEVN
jgi:hypothetical protein